LAVIGQLFQIVAAINDAGVDKGGRTKDDGCRMADLRTPASDFCFPTWHLGGWFRICFHGYAGSLENFQKMKSNLTRPGFRLHGKLISALSEM
jgi:hypothetical protein